jgi:hypothetical protein
MQFVAGSYSNIDKLGKKTGAGRFRGPAPVFFVLLLAGFNGCPFSGAFNPLGSIGASFDSYS